MLKERRYDIDWLRVIAMLAVFLFHCTRLFDTEAWHLKNSQQSEILFIVMRALVWPWVMELFFLLSGFGTWYSLQSRSARTYLWERGKRLLFPLYTVGLFLLLPIQFYFELGTNAGYRGSFWEVLPTYFSAIGLPRVTQAPDELLPFPFSGHLWFLQYLFLISLILLPLLLYLKSERGLGWIRRCAGWSDNRGGIFLFVIPLALVLIGLRGLFEAQRSWADFLWYAVYFVIGYILAADERFTDSIRRHGWVGLAIWLVGFSAGISLLVLVLGYDPIPGHESFSWMYIVYQIIWSLSSWSAVVFMLSMGVKYLSADHKVLTYGNEAVLPFYLLHQTIILCVGYFVISWNLPVLIKLFIVVILSFPLILVLYELLVRRFNATRFLFGMRLRR